MFLIKASEYKSAGQLKGCVSNGSSHCTNDTHSVNKRSQETVCDFALDTSPFHMPDPLMLALAANIDKQQMAPSEGIAELREAIAEHGKTFGFTAHSDQVFIGNSITSIVYIVTSILPGELIIPAPAWNGYASIAQCARKNFHILPTNRKENFTLTAHALQEFLKQHRNKQFILALNNPHYPTGKVFPRGELRKIVALCKKHGIPIIADESAAKTSYDPLSFTSLGVLYPENAFVIGGLSKYMSAEGYGLGYVILPHNTAGLTHTDLNNLPASSYTRAATPIQHAAVMAYRSNPTIMEYIETVRDITAMVNAYYFKRITAFPDVYAPAPHSGFHCFIDFTGNQYVKELEQNGDKYISTKKQTVSRNLVRVFAEEPFRVTMTPGSELFMPDNSLSVALAFTDYDGKQAYHDYLQQPPVSEEEREKFIVEHTPRLNNGMKILEEMLSKE